jgi:hypothetical protein
MLMLMLMLMCMLIDACMWNVRMYCIDAGDGRMHVPSRIGMSMCSCMSMVYVQALLHIAYCIWNTHVHVHEHLHVHVQVPLQVNIPV